MAPVSESEACLLGLPPMGVVSCYLFCTQEARNQIITSWLQIRTLLNYISGRPLLPALRARRHVAGALPPAAGGTDHCAGQGLFKKGNCRAPRREWGSRSSRTNLLSNVSSGKISKFRRRPAQSGAAAAATLGTMLAAGSAAAPASTAERAAHRGRGPAGSAGPAPGPARQPCGGPRGERRRRRGRSRVALAHVLSLSASSTCRAVSAAASSASVRCSAAWRRTAPVHVLFGGGGPRGGATVLG